MNKSSPDRWQPDAYSRHAGFVPELGRPVLALLAPHAGERILDLGCGDGVLTAVLAEQRVDVVGVDASPAQIAAAVARGVDARVMRGEALTFSAEFDAVFSNAALHWMKDVDGVLRSVRRALKPAGRFVAEFGAEGNVATIQHALHEALRRRGIDPAPLDPWYFPSPAAYHDRLSVHGFAVAEMHRIVRPTLLPTNITGWLKTFAGSFLAAVPVPERQVFIDAVRDDLAPKLQDDTGRWMADYVRLRFVARAPSDH